METGTEKENLGFVYDTHFYYERPLILTIAAANTPVPIEFRTSAQSDKVVGIAATVKADNAANNQAISALEMSEDLMAQGVQIVPKSWDLRFFATGLEVTPNERFWEDICSPANTTLIEGGIQCTDTEAALYPMTVKLYFRCTIKNNNVLVK